jgi:hypothetical protein
MEEKEYESEQERRLHRKLRKKATKWAKGMPKELVDEVFCLNPIKVVFEEKYPKYITCFIKLPTNEIGVGLSICSSTELVWNDCNSKWDIDFNRNKGKKQALGMALGALKRKRSKHRVRNDFYQFPNNWTKKMIMNIIDISKIFAYRSTYIKYN